MADPVNNRWWLQWKSYTGYHEKPPRLRRAVSMEDDVEKVDLESSEQALVSKKQRPGPIDNARLCGEIEGELDKGTVCGYSYTLVCEPVWNQLVEWYGGGPAFPTKAIQEGKHAPVLELHRLRVCVYFADDYERARKNAALKRKVSSSALSARGSKRAAGGFEGQRASSSFDSLPPPPPPPPPLSLYRLTTSSSNQQTNKQK